MKTLDTMPTVVGFLPNIVEGDVYTFKGQVVDHPRYGKQLKAETLKRNATNERSNYKLFIK